MPAFQNGLSLGVLQFATAFRPDVAFPVGVGGRCRTYPTAKMLAHMERVLVYLARTASLATNYNADAPRARTLYARSDSDWSVRRSTSGYVISLAGGSVAHGSRRQHNITLSSTEAELTALAELALELLYVRDVLQQIGHVFEDDAPMHLETKDPEAHRLVHAAGDIVHGSTDRPRWALTTRAPSTSATERRPVATRVTWNARC